MIRKAKTVAEYLTQLPPDRRDAVEQLRAVVRANLDKGFEEGMQYGMIGYYVPHALYPPGYHCDPKQPLPFAGIASQKNHLSLYLSFLYGSPQHEKRFREAWAKTGKKLDMGKACIRFRRIEDAALEVIGRAVARVSLKDFITSYESVVMGLGQRQAKTGTRGGSRSAAARARKAPTSARKSTDAARTRAARNPSTTKTVKGKRKPASHNGAVTSRRASEPTRS